MLVRKMSETSKSTARLGTPPAEEFHPAEFCNAMMNDIIHILMTRDDYSRTEAEDTFCDMCERVVDGENPEEILAEYELEPDYIMEII